MKINKLELLSFRCFEKNEIVLSDRFTLLIGDNGSGKTAVLDALAIIIYDLLCEFSSNEIGNKSKLLPDDIRYVDQEIGQASLREPDKSTSIAIDCTLENNEFNWKHGRDSNKIFSFNRNFLVVQKKNSVIKKLMDRFSNKNDSKNLLPLMAYYGTGRLWQQIKAKDKKIKGPGSRFEGYQNCLNPASDQKSFFSWFKTQELASLQKQERRHALEAVREAIVSMIPDAKRAWWDMDWDELRIETVVQGKNQTIPFHLLSDGYRNMIGMVADIAYRMATLNPQLQADVIKQTEGIVLIDEIDLHLHPKWQRQVVGRLLDTFPKVQFVASSHSPFIIQSLYHREDVLLWDLESNQAVAVDSKSIEDIAENQQGVEIPQQSQRFLYMEKAAEAYYTALQKIPSVSEEEKQYLRQRLDDLLLPYSDNPAFQAILKMERQAVDGRH